MACAIEVSGIEKTFIKKRSIKELLTHPFRRAERIHALRGIDFSVQEGEIFGLLGPNGAGKTTLLKILSCLVLPDRGSARVRGEDTRHERQVKRMIGLVHSDERSFYWRLSARENLRFFATLYDLDRRRSSARIEELLRRVDMLEAADRPFSDYSSGMKQRIAIVRALLHDPPVLFMDEPTRSLDPAAGLSLRSFIREELKQRDGKTILLATHNLKEAEALADHVAVLVRGRVRETGTVDQVRRWGIDERRYVLSLSPVEGVLPVGPFRSISEEVQNGERRVTLSLDEKVPLEAVLGSFSAAGLSVLDCDRLEPDLEDAFSRILKSAEDPE